MRGFIVTTCLIGLFATSVPAVDVLQFQKVDYFEVVTKSNGEQDEEKRDARLEIDQDAQQLRIVDEKNGAAKATYAEIPFATVTGVVLREREVAARQDGHLPHAAGALLVREEALAHHRVRGRLRIHAVSTRTTSARSAPHWERLGLTWRRSSRTETYSSVAWRRPPSGSVRTPACARCAAESGSDLRQ